MLSEPWMTRRRFLLSGALSCVAATLPASAQEQNHTAEDALTGPAQGPWRRLFLDAAVVERSHQLARVFHAATKVETPVIRRDEPWEGPSAITGPYVYGTVLWEGDRLRMYYQILHRGNHVGVAESRDAVHWTKPRLGIISFDGSKANNLVVSALDAAATGGGHCHNPSVVRRPNAADAQSRYALYGFDGQRGHPRAAFSPDGLHWSYPTESETTPLFRSSDVVSFCYDPYQSRYFATWKTRNRRGRAVGVAFSGDGLHWTKPFDGPVFAADDLDPDTTQIYGMPAFPYQGLYVGLPWIYHARYFRFGEYSVKRLHEAQADSPRTIDVQLAWSWDLVNWTRSPRREPFIPCGQRGTWDAGVIVTARAPVLVGDQLHFYFGGCDRAHDEPRAQAAIGLATLRLDGFCSLRAGEQEGWFVTRREPFATPAVTINGRTFGDGSIVAEIVDRQDKVIPGFSRDECVAFQGDSVRHVLLWKSRDFPADAGSSDHKLRFYLRNAELFSYLPHGLDPNQRDLTRFPSDGP